MSYFDNDYGFPITVEEARDFLKLELYKGRKVLPMGKKCDKFDYQKGCSGHED